MNLDSALSQIRPITQLIGSIIIAIAACKFAGVNIGIRGEFWQIALMGMALKSF